MYQRMPMGLNISPSICQSYINVILDCHQSRKYCEAINNDLLLFTPVKEVSHGQIGRFTKGIVEEWVEDFTNRSANCLEQICSTWVMKYLYKIKEYVCNP